MHEQKSIKLAFYSGLFFVTLTTMVYQMLLTRIFSVTMWYHFAFVAVSLAMFGLTAGAIIVFSFPKVFTDDAVQLQMARFSLFFSVAIVFCLLTQLAIPFRVAGIVGIYSLFFTYVISTIPFVASGIVVCLALTKFPDKLNRLYAVDLIGAGLGCTLMIPLLHVLDGPTAVVAVASLAAVGAFFFARNCDATTLKRLSIVWALFCLGFVIWHTDRFRQQKPVLSIMWVKGSPDPPRYYEKWNAFSSIRVHKSVIDCNWRELFLKAYNEPNMPEQLQMNIDAGGGTPITSFDGDFSNVKFIRNYGVNLVHYLRPNSDLLVIGTGGGIDILSGLYFKQKKITGVEINNVIIETLNKRFGDFSGHLDKYPNVTFINDEGKSHITRMNETYDIIQANVTDTWAAGASGAFALMENSLYTAEAWTEYLKHLKPKGIITFTRWYFIPFPDEIYRLTGLAVAALKNLGIQETRNHIAIITPKEYSENEQWTTGTILVSKDPFTDEDLKMIETLSVKIPFKIKLTPRFAVDENFAAIANGKNLDTFYRNFPFDISPSTEDRPFFFHRFRFSDVFSLLYKKMPPSGDINMKGIVVLTILLITVFLLTTVAIIYPLFLKSQSFNYLSNFHFLLFFASIGIGFMMVEISQLQRLSIFLGHPTYSLSVVLFSLLIGSGAGSFLSERCFGGDKKFSNVVPLVILLVFIFAFGLVTPWVVQKFAASTTPLRIIISALILLPLGMFMGMPFPIGMKLVLKRSSEHSAWFWGINGACSVCASVLAIAIAISWGISVSFWTGGFFYLLATLSIFRETTKPTTV